MSKSRVLTTPSGVAVYARLGDGETVTLCDPAESYIFAGC